MGYTQCFSRNQISWRKKSLAGGRSWVQYDLLKQHDDSGSLTSKGLRIKIDCLDQHIWKDRQNEVLNDLNSYGMVCVIYKDHQTSITLCVGRKTQVA